MAATARCPRDGPATESRIRSGRFGSFRIDVCPKCGGAWFDKGAVAKACGDRGLQRLIVAYAAGPTGLTCPRCRRELAARPVGDLTLGVCTKCKGVWADDAGELEQAAQMLGESSDVSGETPGELGLARGALARGQFMGSGAAVRGLTPKGRRGRPRDKL